MSTRGCMFIARSRWFSSGAMLAPALTPVRTIALTAVLATEALAQVQKPLPDPKELLHRARISLLQSEKDLEKYSCTVLEKYQELNDDKSVKHEKSTLKDRFYVNGIQLEHVLAKDGLPLSGRGERKEQQHVDKDVVRFSDQSQATGEIDRTGKEVGMFMRAVRFSNGHRETRDGRSIIVYDLSGDPAFHPRSLEERFAQALSGRIWIDEETGQPIELRFKTDKDVKIAGGLFANLHRGFQLHVLRQREPDGVWLTKSVDGSGDARAALFFHPKFRFSEDTEKCHLFSVNTQQKVEAPK
jgi:hypothetical protein